MQNRDIRRTISVDADTDRLWKLLARKHEGNYSMAVRYAIRQTAETELQRHGKLVAEEVARR